MDTTTTQAERAREDHEEELARQARRNAYRARQAAAKSANGGVRPPNDFERTRATMHNDDAAKAAAAGISLKELYRRQQATRRHAKPQRTPRYEGSYDYSMHG